MHYISFTISYDSLATRARVSSPDLVTTEVTVTASTVKLTVVGRIPKKTVP